MARAPTLAGNSSSSTNNIVSGYTIPSFAMTPLGAAARKAKALVTISQHHSGPAAGLEPPVDALQEGKLEAITGKREGAITKSAATPAVWG
jgi:hypothetical protein